MAMTILAVVAQPQHGFADETKGEGEVACAPPADFIQGIPNGYGAPLDSPIAIKTQKSTFTELNDSIGETLEESGYTLITVKYSEILRTHPGSTHVGLGYTVFVPREPLRANITYKATATGPDVPSFSWVFSMSMEESIRHESEPGSLNINWVGHTRKPIYAPCLNAQGCKGRFEERGWVLTPNVRFSLSGVRDDYDSLLYSNMVHEHDPVTYEVVRTHHFNTIDTQRSTYSLHLPLGTAQVCLSLESYRIDAPDAIIPSTSGVICDQLPPEELSEPPPLKSADEACGDVEEPAEEPTDNPTGEPTDNPTGEPTGGSTDTPQPQDEPEPPYDPREDSAFTFCGGCASTPAQGGSIALMWLLGVVGFGLTRKRT